MTSKTFTQARIDRALAQVRMAQVHSDTRLSTAAVLYLTGWSSPTLYRRIQQGKFPAPLDRGKWHAGAVLAHLAGAKEVGLSAVRAGEDA